MYFLYSIIYSLGLVLMVPAFLLDRAKYASGLGERLGNYPAFTNDGSPVIWLHCVSVGETNAARPLAEKLLGEFPGHRLIVSTTTRTGQDLARSAFAEKAAAVIYFPFDLKFTCRRALSHFKPSAVLLMETEIWPRFIHEAKQGGAKVAIVNGRLSETSARRYSKIGGFISRILADIDLALMQTDKDADRIHSLGIDASKVEITGNLKFDQAAVAEGSELLADELRDRFGITPDKPLVIAASTHEPEERYVLDSLEGILGHQCRLMIAPRHPERFDAVEELLKTSPYSFVRRSSETSEQDKDADIILLDSIGELRSAYPLAEMVFVGGSLIPHGGQSILEPAVEGKAIVTGPYTHNFDSVIGHFLAGDAVIRTPPSPDDHQISERLYEAFTLLLEDKERRKELGENAAAIMRAARGNATENTIGYLRPLLSAASEKEQDISAEK